MVLWGHFSAIHVMSLIFALLVVVALFLSLVNKPRRYQILLLFTISLIIAAVTIYNTFTSEDITKNLPLTLWGLSSLLLPYAVLTRKPWVCNLLLLWSAESILILIYNQERAAMNILTFEFLGYFLTHIFIAGIPLVVFWLKLVKRDPKYIPFSLLTTTLAYTVAHFVNIACGTNYLYSINHEGIELFAFFRALIPNDYWYMFLMIPLFFLYLAWWYFPELLDDRRKRKRVKQRLKAIDKYYDEYEDEYIDEIIEEKYGR